jgi:hypothetical protein
MIKEHDTWQIKRHPKNKKCSQNSARQSAGKARKQSGKKAAERRGFSPLQFAWSVPLLLQAAVSGL